jgi:hypothetical protein
MTVQRGRATGIERSTGRVSDRVGLHRASSPGRCSSSLRTPDQTLRKMAQLRCPPDCHAVSTQTYRVGSDRVHPVRSDPTRHASGGSHQVLGSDPAP